MEPVLNGSRRLVVSQKEMRLLTPQELQRSGTGGGMLIVPVNTTSWFGFTDAAVYYASTKDLTLWRFSYQTLKRSKVFEAQRGFDYQFLSTDYADRVITYTRRRLKTAIVKVDNLFVR